MATKAYLTLDRGTKDKPKNPPVIVIDESVEPTKSDEMRYKTYISLGYPERRKSAARVAAMTDKADNLNKEEFLESIKDYPEAVKAFNDEMNKKKGKNFMVAKSKANAIVKQAKEAKEKK